jgi:hypothetical protein
VPLRAPFGYRASRCRSARRASLSESAAPELVDDIEAYLLWRDARADLEALRKRTEAPYIVDALLALEPEAQRRYRQPQQHEAAPQPEPVPDAARAWDF